MQCSVTANWCLLWCPPGNPYLQNSHCFHASQHWGPSCHQTPRYGDGTMAELWIIWNSICYQLGHQFQAAPNRHERRIGESTCYDFEQLKQLLTVAFHKEVAFRAEFRVWDEESLVYWETKTSYRMRLFYSRLYTRGKRSRSMENIWYTYVNNEE